MATDGPSIFRTTKLTRGPQKLARNTMCGLGSFERPNKFSELFTNVMFKCSFPMLFLFLILVRARFQRLSVCSPYSDNGTHQHDVVSHYFSRSLHSAPIQRGELVSPDAHFTLHGVGNVKSEQESHGYEHRSNSHM